MSALNSIKPLPNPEILQKGIWLCYIHCDKTPPHIGISFDRHYSSLHLHGKELNIDFPVLWRKLNIQKIPSVFIQLQVHPVFSNDYLSEVFQWHISSYEKVGKNDATCFSPVKSFLTEFYLMPCGEINYLYQTLDWLSDRKLVQQAYSLFYPHSNFRIPPYDAELIQKEIHLLSDISAK